MDLTDAAVVVTGASRGLGRSMALRFSREGARVVATARSEEALTDLAAEAPGEVLVAPADVRDADAVEGVVDRALDAFGGVDVLVNNAGVGMLSLTGDLAPVEEVAPAEWDLIVETNLRGPFLFTKFALPHMREAGRGNLVNVSSAYGKHGEAGWAPYVSSKHGLEGLTKTTALECADAGVNVNAVTPAGSVDTGFWNTDEKRAHLPPAARDAVQDTDVMDDAMVLLAEQGPDGVSGESLPAPEWERRLG